MTRNHACHESYSQYTRTAVHIYCTYREYILHHLLLGSAIARVQEWGGLRCHCVLRARGNGRNRRQRTSMSKRALLGGWISYATRSLGHVWWKGRVTSMGPGCVNSVWCCWCSLLLSLLQLAMTQHYFFSIYRWEKIADVILWRYASFSPKTI
jgi:hypothetical protein